MIDLVFHLLGTRKYGNTPDTTSDTTDMNSIAINTNHPGTPQTGLFFLKIILSADASRVPIISLSIDRSLFHNPSPSIACLNESP